MNGTDSIFGKQKIRGLNCPRIPTVRRQHHAEGEGFEPPEPCSSTVFKTAAIDHSAILPVRQK